MAVNTSSLSLNIHSYQYTSADGPIYITTPLENLHTISLTTPNTLLKSFSQNTISLNQPFSVSYEFLTDANKSSFSNYGVTDPLLNGANGFTYGTPTLMINGISYPSVILTFNADGTLLIPNYYLSQLAVPGDTLLITIPIIINSPTCQNYLNAPFTGQFNNEAIVISGQTVTPAVFDPPHILTIYLVSDHQTPDALYPGSPVTYHFYFANTGESEIVIPPYSMTNPLSSDVIFSGWGGYGYTTDLSLFTYDPAKHQITNLKNLIIPPQSQSAYLTYYQVTVK